MKKVRRETYLRFYIYFLIAIGSSILGFTGGRLFFEPFDTRWVVLAGLAALSSFFIYSRIPAARNVIACSETFLFLTLLLCGANAAMLVAAIAVASDFARYARRWRALATNVAVTCCAFFVASSLLSYLFGDLRLLAHRKETFFVYALALGLLAALYSLVYSWLVLTGVALNTRKPILATWREGFARILVIHFSAVLAAGVVNGFIQDYGFWAAGLVIPILLAIYLAYRPYIETAHRHMVELQRSEARFRSAFDNAAIGMALVDLNGRWLQVNPSLCKILGYSEQELKALNFQSLTHREDLPSSLQYVSLLLEGKLPSFQLEKRYIHKLGYTVWVLWSASLARDGASKSARLIFQIQDITERQRAKEQLLHEAFHDSLTGLPNRALFLQYLKLALERVKCNQEPPFAIFFLDLDRFKLINDSLGHVVGDQLLKGIADRLGSCLRPGDRVARLSGDEFALLVRNIEDANDATEVAERIRQQLMQPFNLSGHEVFTTVSIGIAHSASGYEHPEDMLRDADTAMYRAKSLGTSRHEVFDKAMHSNALGLLQLETDLRRAVEREEFLVHYQPIVALENGKLHGFEALVRWEHPEQGMVSPGKFIPLAEETGLIVQIGNLVLREACRQMREWQNLYPASFPLQMSVNLSGKQFLQPDLMGRIKEILRLTRLDPHYLKLEITESVVMDNVEVAIGMLKQIRALGIALSIDDFGTGYSSLSYLHKFPLNTLKVDRSFVSQMKGNNENTEIVRTIITLAKALRMDVIAEGTETREQVAQLRALGCKYGQGYYFSKPLSAKAAGQLIGSHKQWEVATPAQTLRDQQDDPQLIECTVVM
jgi:diguanylate cyclase (GGDEF)-like protein/PAS domain S-box-containing protein